MRSGKKFKSLAAEIGKEYLKKGFSKAKAKYIGRAAAGKIFYAKFGKAKAKGILAREH